MESHTNPGTHTTEQQQETGVHNRQELRKVHLNTEPSSGLHTVSYLQGRNHYKCFLVYFPGSNRATIEFFLLLIKTRKQFSQTLLPSPFPAFNYPQCQKVLSGSNESLKPEAMAASSHSGPCILESAVIASSFPV